MPILTIRALAPEDQVVPLHQVRLRFVPTRTRFGRASAVGPLTSELLYHAADVEVRVAMPRAAVAGDEYEIGIEYEGEPPSAPRVEFLPGGPLAPVATGFATSVVAAWRLEVEQSSAEYAMSFRAQRDAEIRTISQAHPHLRDALRFFEAFDVATSPVFLRIANRRSLASAVDRMTMYLLNRLQLRMQGREMPRPHARDLTSISELQLGLIRDHFFSAPGGLQRFDEAFVAFAAGHLSQPTAQLWNGRPNSALFFLFAEFAFAVIEATPEPSWTDADAEAWRRTVDFWGELLPTFVYSEFIFPDVFEPFCARNGQRQIIRREERRFRTYRGQGPTTDHAADAIAHMRDLRAHDNTALDTLRSRHVEAGRLAFNMGWREPSAACAIRSTSPHPIHASPEAESIPMNRFHTMMRSLAKGPANSCTEGNRWFLMAPDSWEVPEDWFDNFAAAAQHATDGMLAGGPFTVVYDCVNESWDEHPEKPKKIVFEEGTTTFYLSDVNRRVYESAEYDTFVVVIKRPEVVRTQTAEPDDAGSEAGQPS